LTYSFQSGSVFTDPTVPITDFKARFHAQVFSYYRSFNFFGRSANVVGSVPYAVGNFSALVAGSQAAVYRSGLADARVRMSVNLHGGKAMPVRGFMEWREKTIVGASLTAIIPTGQYDPVRVINPGNHRWAVKPEVGFSRRFGKWGLDLYGGAWFFSTNSQYFPGNSIRSQSPVLATEAHLVRYLTKKFWFSGDVNYWTGGRSTVNGDRNLDYQRNSRIGCTAAVPVTTHQSVKVSYNRGAYIQVGGDYQNVSVGWQYSWITGAPR
jgi:hypothetical protein